MGLFWRLVVSPLNSLLGSETAHKLSLFNLRLLSSIPLIKSLLPMLYSSPHIPINVMNLTFSNPLGLAAGMDKNGDNLSNWENIGFGWQEIGGITLHHQAGNPKPRMFRSNKHKALINRMGLNNSGSKAIAEKMEFIQSKGRWPRIPVAINIGKNSKTSNDQAEKDYSGTMKILWKFGNIFVINVSSPNTLKLRDLQEESELERIILACKKVNEECAEKYNISKKPLLIKVSPDLSDSQICAIADLAIQTECSGIIATNTTTKRPGNQGVMIETGGLSGEPLKNRSTQVIHLIYEQTKGKIPIIGVGGISSPQSAWEKVAAGASLLQLYSGLVFHGPKLIKLINKGLLKKIKEHDYASFSEAVGHAHRGELSE